jgi:hypothetical protein
MACFLLLHDLMEVSRKYSVPLPMIIALLALVSLLVSVPTIP